MNAGREWWRRAPRQAVVVTADVVLTDGVFLPANANRVALWLPPPSSSNYGANFGEAATVTHFRRTTGYDGLWLRREEFGDLVTREVHLIATVTLTLRLVDVVAIPWGPYRPDPLTAEEWSRAY